MNVIPRYLNFSDCFSDASSTSREHRFGCMNRHMVSAFAVLIFNLAHSKHPKTYLEVAGGSDGHDKPFCTKAITIIDNLKKALGDTDNR